ncbi:MAG: cobaltochelatase subunit CobN [Rhodospirillales bacterium]|nr:cobaltochelatase subunit CobN [Rhodospirillales bacterium]
MHIVFRESHGLEEAETPHDLCQDPAEIVVLSFSDSDLGAFAAAWQGAKARGLKLPSLRLANLALLRHPVSVDVYAEKTLSGAKAVLVRLIGGEGYWAYGLGCLRELAERNGLKLAVLPGDGRPDAVLEDYSTLPAPLLGELARLCDAGGPEAALAVLAHLAREIGHEVSAAASTKLPDFGIYEPEAGIAAEREIEGPPRVPVVFYRSYLTAADMEPVDALIEALADEGFDAYGLFVPSLKMPEVAAFLAAHFKQQHPVAIVNATAFSAAGDNGATPLDGPNVPVFQVALSTARRDDWMASERGLSPADLAMHVALPEIDGRIFLGVISFKSSGTRDEDLQFSRNVHRAEPERIKAVAGKVSAWYSLGLGPPPTTVLAMVLSTYPGRPEQMAHAVGLDALESANEILRCLQERGYHTWPVQDLAGWLQKQYVTWSLEDYERALQTLPLALQYKLNRAWGRRKGGFRFYVVQLGSVFIALQPERGVRQEREAQYHDLSAVPRHEYVAFYLWLRAQRMEALIHLGAHGTLEWLPGKSVALSGECWPEALIGDLPVIYPFIVNDPGEAAQATRRIGAVTIGHLPPPLASSAMPEHLQRLEALLDEYATAEGLDPKRRERLIGDIRAEARARGVEQDLELAADASLAEAITRIDRFVCDLKESRFGDGLHVFGTGVCGAEERAGLLAALDGRRVAPGPSGSPARARADVLPTGRNMFTVDPRAIPTRTAHAQGVKLAEELLRRHLQENGDWPKSLLIDLWGSATMRNAGEEFAMALHLAGLAPRWEENSARVSGFEILPPALLGRPRIDVTLRISGLFRDVFSHLAQLFAAGAEALAAREEMAGENPYVARGPRVFGPRPGQYGMAMGDAPVIFTKEARAEAAQAWLAGAEWSIGTDGVSRETAEALRERLRGTDGFVHVQDLPETDLLLAADYAAHEGGVVTALESLGVSTPPLYHLDATRPDTPRARLLNEEIAKVVRARAANPAWVGGMMRHGFRGGAELAATLDHMAAFANLARAVPGHLFDLYFEATLGRDEVAAFLAAENPAALARMRDVFARLRAAGLWETRNNAIVATLEAP